MGVERRWAGGGAWVARCLLVEWAGGGASHLACPRVATARECGSGGSMGRRFLVTARIRRAGRSRQVRVVFLVQFLRSSRPRSASWARAFVTMVLRLERILRRGPLRNPGPGRKGPRKLHRTGAVVPRASMHLPHEVEGGRVRVGTSGGGGEEVFLFGLDPGRWRSLLHTVSLKGSASRSSSILQKA